MTEYEASRTLVKSPPELWAELSDEVSLAGHLAEPFGEIRITRLEPETAVAWEGERASGTVRIEPSGWGTRVTLTARAVQVEPPEEEKQPEQPLPEPAPLPRPAPAPEPLPPAAEESSPEAPQRGFLARLRDWFGRKSAPERAEAPPAETAEPASVTPPVPPVAETTTPIDPDAVLVGVLDKLGAAHHRPFSRA
ncbi:MAG: hypothetical protein M3065_05975 [Actinomycetota bacterium]|nr:hypothetical protein [Actinomycetota bacterium]